MARLGKVVEIMVSPLPGNDRDTYFVVVNDISKIQQYLKQTQLIRFRNVYFASLAHDLRTPINAIQQMNMSLMQLLEQRYHHMLHVSNGSCQFLLSIIDDILDMSRL